MQQPVIFVTGTDTDVGKTFVSALLAHKWSANYWKPVQTGIESDEGDSTTLSKSQSALPWKPKIYPPRYELLKPLSPYKAMDYEPEIDIHLSDFNIPSESTGSPLIIEGAGGAFVPVTKKLETMTDLMRHIAKSCGRRFKIIVVARSGLGTLNHTLLTIDHLKNAGLNEYIMGIIVNGERNADNVQVFQDYGIRILAEVERSSSLEAGLRFIPPLNQLLN